MSSRLQRTLDILLHVGDTPHRTAVAFGIGVYIAFFPILGIHTGLALAIAFLFRLNRVAILLGAYVNNPWTLVPMYMAGTLVGCFLMDVPTGGLTEIDTRHHGMAFYRAMLETLRPYLWPFVLGNTVLGVAAAFVGYLALRSFLLRRRAAAPA